MRWRLATCSPPPDRILTCTRSASTGAGVLYIYGNYTGDLMNFDMAAELAAGEGIEVRTILTTDDVASSAAEDRAGRRGTAGNVFVFKIAGAACDRMYSLTECERLARKANAATFTMGLGLEPCSLPETQRPSFRLGENDMEVGIGIHGEPGVTRQPLETADAAADRIFDRLMAEMELPPGARVALLVNSLGGTPMMELFILNRRIQQRLTARNIEVTRCLVGHYCTSLDMVGASITLMRLDDELLDLYDHPCAGFAWATTPQ
jgi:phosphoenolpyruvate---glycerone phosphotransferase subunit DhaK